MSKISIKLGTTERRKSFKNKEVLLEFIAQEKTYWNQFFDDRISSSPMRQPLQYIKSNFINNFAQIERLANSILDDETNLESIITQIEQSYLMQKIFYSRSAYIKWIETFEDNNLSVSLVGVSIDEGFKNVLFDQNGNIRHYTRPFVSKILIFMQEALIKKSMYENGYLDNLEQEKESLSTLKEEWDELLSKAESNLESNNTSNISLQEELQKCKDNVQRQYEINKKKFISFMNKSKAEMKDFEEFYEKKLALDSAVVYWNNKKETSYKWAIGLAVVIILVGGVSISYLLGISEIIGSHLADTNATEGIVGHLKYLPILHFAVISTFVIWGLRLLVKVFLSKLHIADNAAEREMFIKSYLALLNEHEEGVKDDNDRQLILQAIFRPSSDGLINDDGPKITDILNAVNRRNT
jgi:hypothetical protein